MSLESQILALADRCVKCGLCLPHCPTYKHTLIESESPRGRIALMQGLASSQLSASPVLIDHLQRCLDCRYCERVCPAGVEYESLLDMSRHWLNHYAAKPLVEKRQRKIVRLFSQPHKLRQVHQILRLYRMSGLHWLFRRSGVYRLLGLEYMASLLPPLRAAATFSNRTIATSKPRGRVALFTGCLGSTLEQTTIQSSLLVLNHLGYTVDLVSGQTCCGALAQHAGEAEDALSLAQQNLQAFRPAEVEAILFTSSGCGAHLIKYAELHWPQAELKARATEFANKLQEITAFLTRLDWPDHLRFQGNDKRIAVHEPCSHKNGLRQTVPAMALLGKIPGLTTEFLPGNNQCCGAAGNYMLRQPAMADTLRQEKLRAMADLKPDLLVTTNSGCALFLNAGLGYRPLRVVHPVTVLAESLATENKHQS